MADIRHAIQIAARPEAVYLLCATARGFEQWWAADVTERDGVVELGFFNRTTIYRLRRQTANPPYLVEWVCETGNEWEGTQIIFRLEAAGSNTMLRFFHKGWQSETDYFISCNTTWGELMFRLKGAAEGKSPGPLFLADKLGY
jgi:hypothetical protein